MGAGAKAIAPAPLSVGDPSNETRGRGLFDPDRGETAETYWRKLKGEAPTAEETELFDRLVASFKAMNPCHCSGPSKKSA